MANKELLYIILVSIIVGISIIVAINVLKELDNESNKDSIKQELLLATSNAQSFYNKPVYMGGGGGSFINISFKDLGIDTSGFNGVYFILETQDKSFILNAITRDNADTISATIDKNGLSWN